MASSRSAAGLAALTTDGELAGLALVVVGLGIWLGGRWPYALRYGYFKAPARLDAALAKPFDSQSIFIRGTVAFFEARAAL